MRLSLGKKILGTVLVVVAMLFALGGVSYWASHELVAAADEAKDRLQDAANVNLAAFWAIKQYQNQADLVINQDMKLVKEFEESAGKFEESLNKIRGMVDTAEEKAWLKAMEEADEKFDRIYNEGVVPAVEYQLKGVIQQLDGEADVIIGGIEDYAKKIAASLQEEFIEAAEQSNDTTLVKRAEDLDAVNKLVFWAVKQYQNQADLIINQNLETMAAFKESAAQMKKYKDLVGKAVDTPEEKEWYAKMVELEDQFTELFHKKVVPAVEIELRKDIQRLDGESDEALSIVEENVEKLVSSLGSEATEAVESYQATSSRVRATILAISIGAATLGLLLGFLIARSITKNLTVISEELGNSADQVAAASSQVSSTSQQLAEGASEQAAALEETSSSMEEMASMTRANADNASQADSLMAESNHIVEQAGHSMNEMAASMTKIAESGDEISKIVKSIDEIAFQTNLLALNAAVEAARAGEAGMGFAVVADEVRNLAQRAADAAKNTQSLIEDTVRRIGQGTDLVSKTKEEFEQVVDSATRAASLVSEIASASNEQAQGIEQVNTAISQMDQAIQRSAAGSEEGASASEEMDAMAVNMKGMVEQLTALINGDGNGRHRQETIEYNNIIPKHLPGPVHAMSVGNGNGKVMDAKLVGHMPKPGNIIPMEDDFKDF